MKKMIKKISLNGETLRTMSGVELRQVAAGVVDVSIIYWCPDNTSIVRSCSSCTGSGTA